jgi:hypothetical protein
LNDRPYDRYSMKLCMRPFTIFKTNYTALALVCQHESAKTSHGWIFELSTCSPHGMSLTTTILIIFYHLSQYMIVTHEPFLCMLCQFRILRHGSCLPKPCPRSRSDLLTIFCPARNGRTPDILQAMPTSYLLYLDMTNI